SRGAHLRAPRRPVAKSSGRAKGGRMKLPRFRLDGDSTAMPGRNEAPTFELDPVSLLSQRRRLNGHKVQMRERPRLSIVILGPSANGHATTYRGLVRELSARGHDVLFLERASESHSRTRDLSNPPCGRTEFYRGIKELKNQFASAIRGAEFVMVGS